VIDSRPADAGRSVRRRRVCSDCEQRFTTYERVSAIPVVVKRTGLLEPFDRGKVRAGLEKAVAGREVPPGAIEAIVRDVEAHLAEVGPEITSEDVGRIVLEGLRDIDEVAYLRFASVYKGFEGAVDFEREMAALEGDT
jgi:transcriptional repressor NrdR